ncbi:MAG: SCO family protein [Burkholderiales bacterium]|nr:SCO family protein [Burkholderiales bacterium]
MTRRAAVRALFACAVAVAAAACGDTAPRFRHTDITGADYAKDFALTDHTGRKVSLADYRGRVVTVFFGFTQCPDVCPTALAEMREVVEKLGPDGQRLQVLFITVDPERDTQALLAQYVPAFHPSFVGLYGDAAATARVAKDFKVFYQKVPGKTPGSYTMDHSAGTYVYDPQGRLRLFVRPPPAGEPASVSAERLIADIRLLLGGA